MTLLSEKELPDDESRSIAAAVREELARRRISRQFLADEARISISTLEKALSGRRPFTLATTIRLEEALGIRLRRTQAAVDTRPLADGLAPDTLGSYARPAVGWIEGSYLTLRPSFGDPKAIYAYRTEIAWEDASSSLVFRETERLDTAFTQHGSVSLPNQSGHIYLVTNRHGQYRLIVVGRPTIAGEMYGILTTLQAGRGSQLTPIAAPIALIPVRADETGALQFGRIAAGDTCYPVYRRHLDRVTRDEFAMFLVGAGDRDTP
jgi:transcriptional regulator with XRE-family HTH domain